MRCPRRFCARAARGGWLALAGLLLSSPLTVGAGTISLHITSRASVEEGTLIVEAEIENQGDESAASLAPVLHFRGREARAPATSDLPPGQALQASLRIDAKDLGEGRWPYRLVVAYADANQYPFHAVQAGTAVVGSPPPAEVAIVRAEEASLARRGHLTVAVKNLSAEAKQVQVELHLPESVELEHPIEGMQLEPWEERTATAALRNRTGLTGSRYAVFASAEYDEEGIHQAVVVPTALAIVPESSRWTVSRHWLWAGALLVVAFWLLLVLRRRGARSR